MKLTRNAVRLMCAGVRYHSPAPQHRPLRARARWFRHRGHRVRVDGPAAEHRHGHAARARREPRRTDLTGRHHHHGLRPRRRDRRPARDCIRSEVLADQALDLAACGLRARHCGVGARTDLRVARRRPLRVGPATRDLLRRGCAHRRAPHGAGQSGPRNRDRNGRSAHRQHRRRASRPGSVRSSAGSGPTGSSPCCSS